MIVSVKIVILVVSCYYQESRKFLSGRCLLTCLLVVVILFYFFFSEYCANTWGPSFWQGWWCPGGKGGLMHCALVFEVVNSEF